MTKRLPIDPISTPTLALHIAHGPQERASLIKQIEAGELEYIEFPATVFVAGKNHNHLNFYDHDLPRLAKSFEGKPFLRDHNEHSIEARDGTIRDSVLDNGEIKQTIRLTTRKGMLAYIEGQIDRFSIGWYYDSVNCSICNADWMECSHMPGRTYEGRQAELMFVNPTGKETSAVNAPAVDGTGLLSILSAYKLEAKTMSDKVQQGQGQNPDPSTVQAILDLNGAQTTLAELQANQERADVILRSQLSHLLTSALAASNLPAPMQDAIRADFTEGETVKMFAPAELSSRIERDRKILTDIESARMVQGPARVSGMFSTDDQIRAAFDDLMGNEREKGLESIKPARLGGIREAYMLLTGDYDLHGGYYPLQAQLQLTSTNFPGLVKNALNKALVRHWDMLGREGYAWWEKIATVEHFNSVNDVTWMIFGTIGSLPVVSEGAEYTPLKIGDGAETSSFVKRGGYVGLTLEAIDRDDTRALRAIPRELANAALRNISARVAEIFTTGSGAGPTMADGGALFNATAVTTAGGHANLLTTALGTDYTAWDAVSKAVYDQPMLIANEAGYYGTGSKMAINPKYCLVPRALGAAAWSLFGPRWSNVVDTIPSAGGPMYMGQVEPIIVPEWTDATDWAAAVDPKILPGIMIGERFGLRPEIFIAGNETDPAMFANDESRVKVRHFLAVGVADFRPLHKSNVAA